MAFCAELEAEGDLAMSGQRPASMSVPIRNVAFTAVLEGKRTCHGDRESDVHDPTAT